MIIIAEIGTSHGGSLQKAFQMIDEAYNAGADCVKFQWVYAEEILHPDTGYVNLPTGNIRLYDRFKELEVDSEFFLKCKDYAHSLGLLFACSPFGLKSLEELVKINPDAIKIASPEVNHYPMLQEISKYFGQIPIILSSGVSKLGDIEKAIEIITQSKRDISPRTKINKLNALTLLHCITFYPAPEEEYNVKCVKTLSQILGVPTGISDHSLDPILVPVLNTIMGGTMIEKHITLSKETDGLDDPVALEQEQFSQMVHCIHQTETLINRYIKEETALNAGHNNILEDDYFIPKAAFDQTLKQLTEQYSVEKIQNVLGSGIKKLSKSESINYGRTNRSLHYTRSIKKGESIKKEDIAVLRTEKILSPGISPSYLDQIIGSILKRDISDGEGVNFTDFIEQDPKYISVP